MISSAVAPAQGLQESNCECGFLNDARQAALVHESGTNRTYLSGVERLERNVAIDNIARIAKGLQVEPWKLLKGD